jgi:glycosyltransferase involved in cell wall biosynthesis
MKGFVRRIGKGVMAAGVRLATRHWRPYSRLFIVGDGLGPLVSEYTRELEEMAQHIGVYIANPKWVGSVERQAVFYGSRYAAMRAIAKSTHNRVGTAYFHGRPGAGVPEFDDVYKALCRLHHRLARLQVTHTEMRDIVLGSGIVSEKVFLIPIAINLACFYPQTPESRRRARARYDVPESAVVIGSFQKDGVGWGEGLQPKLVKGPDVFLEMIEILKPQVPEIFVLLSGPARGYIKVGLERLGVPWRQYVLDCYSEIGKLFQTLDIYIVASRQEGGPRAVLESMASGVPLVTTRVGQAMDLVRHGGNGWMVEVEDAEGLAYWAEYAIAHRSSISDVLDNARQTAEANSCTALIPLWERFMRGFVEQ